MAKYLYNVWDEIVQNFRLNLLVLYDGILHILVYAFLNNIFQVPNFWCERYSKKGFKAPTPKNCLRMKNAVKYKLFFTEFPVIMALHPLYVSENVISGDTKQTLQVLHLNSSVMKYFLVQIILSILRTTRNHLVIIYISVVWREVKNVKHLSIPQNLYEKRRRFTQTMLRPMP